MVFAAIAVTGCTSSFEKVRETVSQAPDWYDERAAEVRGEGYPEIGRIPSLQPGEASDAELVQSRESVSAAESLFFMDPRAVPPGLELIEITAWAESLRAVMAELAAVEAEHLTDEDVARLRAIFEQPRAAS